MRLFLFPVLFSFCLQPENALAVKHHQLAHAVGKTEKSRPSSARTTRPRQHALKPTNSLPTKKRRPSESRTHHRQLVTKGQTRRSHKHTHGHRPNKPFCPDTPIHQDDQYRPGNELAMWASTYHLPGNTMANGEKYRSYAPQVAHRSLPLGSKLRLEHPETGKSVTVKVTDVGPNLGTCPQREIDLPEGLAASIGLKGVQSLRVTIVSVGARDRA